jgi:hypothetical protein
VSHPVCLSFEGFPERARALTSVVYKPGDWVIYTMQKRSRHPGPRARSVHPAEMGDDYGYVVDKFWIVVDSLSDGSVLLKTRRGKAHTVRCDDPLLRKAGWWERWRYKDRFPPRELLSEAQQQSSAAAGV